MGCCLAMHSIFLHLLVIIIMCGVHGINAKNKDIDGINVLQLHSMDHSDHHHHHHQMMEKEDNGSPSSHMDHIDPSSIVFFKLEDLNLGEVMPIHFPKRDISSSPHFLPKQEADSIPFSSKSLTEILHLFSFPKGSPQAIAIEDTLKQCENKPIIGETKLCATSLESMVDFTRGVFGLDSQMRSLSTTHLSKSTILFQNYTILRVPTEIWAPQVVACHTMPYPYGIFYCHSQVSESKVFKVSLGGENGDRVEAVAVCHMDTSKWSRKHVSFSVLRIEPGTSPVCHFFPRDHLVWVPQPT